MEDILKFQRIQGLSEAIVKNETIVCATIETNYLIIGTARGEIHIVSFAGQQIQRFKPHNKRINAISVWLDSALNILSCDDDGNIVTTILTSDEIKSSINRFSEPISSVMIEPGSLSKKERKERSFVYGTRKGRLIWYRSAWFSQKEIVLFPGDNSPVQSLAWKNELVAWSDHNFVRVMDINTQTAICQINAPQGVGSYDPYPCHLFWKTHQELYISWADSFRLLEIKQNKDTQYFDPTFKSSNTIVEWKSDTIICGLYPLDNDHVVYLGYSPPSEQEVNDNPDVNNTNEPEVIIADLKTGEIVCADILPLHGVNMFGPFSYILLSSYQCQENISEINQWKLKNYNQIKGSDRGKAPILFIFSSEDIVLARIRDVNDRVRVALEQKDLKLAIDIANSDQISLKKYQFSELITLYIVSLLERNCVQLAASECFRLLGKNPTLWETWIHKFIDYKQFPVLLEYLTPDIISLNASIYEEVIDVLIGQYPELFLSFLLKWKSSLPTSLMTFHDLLARIQQHVFAHSGSLSLVSSKHASSLTSLISMETLNSYLQLQAQLYLYLHQYDKALSCYLEINTSHSLSASSGNTFVSKTSSSSSISNAQQQPPMWIYAKETLVDEERNGYKFNPKEIFELIIKENLFDLIENRIAPLLLLSKSQSIKLLVTFIDKLPVKSIVSQIEHDAYLCFWYLNNICLDVNTREMYFAINNQKEFREIYEKHLKYFIDFAISPKVLFPQLYEVETSNENENVNKDLSSSQTTHNPNIYRRKALPETDFLLFIKTKVLPVDLILQEINKRSAIIKQSLFLELVYLYSQLGEWKQALTLLLHEGVSIYYIVDFIDAIMMQRPEEYSFRPSLTMNNTMNNNITNTIYEDHEEQKAKLLLLQNELWEDLLNYVMDKPVVFSHLLDCIGCNHFTPSQILQRIPNTFPIPHLRNKLLHIIQLYKDQLFIQGLSGNILQTNAIQLLSAKNHGQRKGIRVDSAPLRCHACLRPLAMEPGVFNASSLQTFTLPTNKASIQIWGAKSSENNKLSSTLNQNSLSSSMQQTNNQQTVFFSNKMIFHRSCYDKIPAN